MKLLSFDIESNGLHGAAFAVGAVLLGSDGHVADEFQARCPIVGPVDPWVTEHVLPSLASLPQTHASAKSMRAAFWPWYRAAAAKADYTLATNPCPVEARFLIACQEDDMKNRYFEHPFPLIDLGTLYVQAGARSPEARDRLVDEVAGDEPKLEHHPRWDALIAARIALKLLSRT